MMKIYKTTVALILCTFVVGCTAIAPPSYDKFSAIAWTKSAEGKIALWETFSLATSQLSIVHSQSREISFKPQAVVMDLDETVLDNSDFQLSLAMSGTLFSEDKFNHWTLSRKASSIPGAVEFIRQAMERGLTVFFVTNRSSMVKSATKDNLQTIGVNLPTDIDTVLCVGDRPEWSKNKKVRWDYIETKYKIIMYVGDSVYDFPIDGNSNPKNLAAENQTYEHWGHDWILLPNPMYGGWETYITH